MIIYEGFPLNVFSANPTMLIVLTGVKLSKVVPVLHDSGDSWSFLMIGTVKFSIYPGFIF